MITPKKASIELQFNWLFVLIIGFVILLFFIGLTQSSKKASQNSIDLTIKKSLNTIFTSFMVNPEDTVKTIELPKTRIEFYCDYLTGASGYSIGKYTQDIKSDVFFSPNYIEGSTLTAWTMPWELPFFITNFLFVTSPNARYIFVNDPHGMMQKLNSTLKDKRLREGSYVTLFNKQLIDPLDIVYDENNYRVKIIFIDGSPPENWPLVPDALVDYDDIAVSALNITPLAPLNNLNGWGKITFYRKQGNRFLEENQTYYLGRESLIGAIFSQDAGMYLCSMRKALDRMSKVALIYENRSKQMNRYLETAHGFDNSCKAFFYSAGQVYGEIARTKCMNMSCVSKLYDLTLNKENDNSLIRKNYYAIYHSCGPLY